MLTNASVESISAQLTQRLRQQAGSYRFPDQCVDLALGVSPTDMNASEDVGVIRFDPVRFRFQISDFRFQAQAQAQA